MFGKKTISPEEKLLRIIEQPKSKAGSGIAINKKDIPAALVSLKGAIVRFNFLDLTNRLLFGAAVLSTGFFVFALLMPTPLTKSQPWGHTAKLEIQQAADAAFTKQDEYLQTIIRKNMFDVIDSKDTSSVSNQRVEQLGLKLVGIIATDKDQLQAIIEDKDGRTYLGSPNDTILDSIKIEMIQADKVILKRDDETLELK
jgi:type II secretory pathway component PulC